MAKTVLIPIDDNQGYAPDQISTRVTLQDMLESIQEAIDDFGSDALVVLHNGQRTGAGFGRFQSYDGGIEISDASPDYDEDGNEYDTSADGKYGNDGY